MSEPLLASQVLEDAADRIERDGWWQGEYYPGSGNMAGAEAMRVAVAIRRDNPPCCVNGAIIAASDSATLRWMARRFISAYSLSGLVQWNDHPEQTKEQVVAALRAAALRAREAGA